MTIETRERSAEPQTAQHTGQQIVPAASRGLAVRSAALVVRGLRDMARDSNWLIKKVFPEFHAAPSDFGDGVREFDCSSRSRRLATRGPL